jgi:hypothetical protein
MLGKHYISEPDWKQIIGRIDQLTSLFDRMALSRSFRRLKHPLINDKKEHPLITPDRKLSPTGFFANHSVSVSKSPLTLLSPRPPAEGCLVGCM